MKRIISMLLIIAMTAVLFSGCNSGNDKDTNDTAKASGDSAGDTKESSDTSDNGEKGTDTGGEEKAEIVDGRFVETRHITVEIFDRSNDGGTAPEDNFFTDFIKEGMLRDHNVEVTFVPVPRWTEVEQINNLLASGDAPDICVTYSYPTIQTYANMGGVIDMAPYIEENKDKLPDMFDLLTDQNIYYDQDPTTGTIWAVEARLANLARINTFVRKDWLEKLDIPEPTTQEEFEKMLVAFKDNADLLLGDEADKMVPFSVSFDVGWRAEHLIQAYMPSTITDKEQYIYGFDDRNLTKPGIKEAIRVVNKWYNSDLVWKDFPLYGSGDTTEDNMMKAGYVGSFMHNWDYPYRNGDDSINNNIKRLVGEEADYVAIMPFKNDAGEYTKYRSATVDRKVFFPTTNDEPVASLMYLNWMSKLENRKYLQIGEEGVNHEVLEDGSIKMLPATGEMIMNSPSNIDYTIVINGLDLGDPELTIKSLAYSYSGVDPDIISTAYEYSITGYKYIENHNFGEISSESSMGPSLSEKRDTMLTQSVVASEDDFDQVFDSGLTDYLNSGGQAIIDERTQKWEAAME